jgi:hypothetical protein
LVKSGHEYERADCEGCEREEMILAYPLLLAFMGGPNPIMDFFNEHPWLYFIILGVAIALVVINKLRR